MFHVIAGKYDGYEENCKFADSFDSIDKALECLKTVNDYPWSRIEYKGYVINAYKLQGEQ